MKKLLPLLLVASFFLSRTMTAQEQAEVFYLDQLFKVTSEANAPFKLELKRIAGESYSGVVIDYLGIVKSKGTYLRVSKKYLEDGHFIFFYQNGQVESEGEYERGVKVGSWRRFDQAGRRKADRYYPAEHADLIRETMMIEKEE